MSIHPTSLTSILILPFLLHIGTFQLFLTKPMCFCLLIAASNYGMARPQFVDIEDGLRVCMVEANV